MTELDKLEKYLQEHGYKYDQKTCGISTKERAEMGLKIARCYGECRIVEVNE